MKAVARYSHAPSEVQYGRRRITLWNVSSPRVTTVLLLREVHNAVWSLRGFADASYYESRGTDWRNASGWVVMCGGAMVSWYSRTQKCVIRFLDRSQGGIIYETSVEYAPLCVVRASRCLRKTRER